MRGVVCVNTDCGMSPSACRSQECEIAQCGACQSPITGDDGFLCDLCDRLAPDDGFVSGGTLAKWSSVLLDWASDSGYEYRGFGVFRDEHGGLWDAGDLYDYMVEVREYDAIMKDCNSP